MALTKIIIGPNSSGIAEVQAGSGGGGSSAAPPQFSNQFNNPLGTLAGDSQQVWFPNVTSGHPGLLLLNSFDALVTPPVSGSFTPGFINYGHSAVGSFAAVDTVTVIPGDTGGHSATVSIPNTLCLNDFFSSAAFPAGPNGLFIEVSQNYTGIGGAPGLTGALVDTSVVSQSSGPLNGLFGVFGGASNFGAGNVSQIIGLQFLAVHSGTSGDCSTVKGIFIQAQADTSSGSVFTGDIYGVDAPVLNSGGLAGKLIGFRTELKISSFGTNTNAYGFLLDGQVGLSPTNVFGVYISVNSGVTNNYGLVVEDYSVANTGVSGDDFNIWSKGSSSINKFEGTITTGSGTVANLGTRFTAPTIGMRYMVTDATQTLTAGIGAIVAGTGANKVPVVYDGTNWRIG